MQGIERIDTREEMKSQDEMCIQFLKRKNIDDDTMNKFHPHTKKIKAVIGEELRKKSGDYKQQQEENKRQQRAYSKIENRAKQNQPSTAINKTNKNTKRNEEQMRQDWLKERDLPAKPKDINRNIRQAATKWIDAKLFFQHLTSGMNSGKARGLDNHWKAVFAMGDSEDNLFERYFHTLDPQNLQLWPQDFDRLLEKFERFVKES
ncbi:hypothetical protein I4U23_016224 [Adineta vaga]|nr:hypothetical protein I4U23_016224 [Adineta vaga]